MVDTMTKHETAATPHLLRAPLECDNGMTCWCPDIDCRHQCWSVIKQCGHTLGECDC